MNALTVKRTIQRDNKRMQVENMMRQSMAGWDANYHLCSDFVNYDDSNIWADRAEWIAGFATGLCIVLAAVIYGAFV